jgi:thioredoxin-related protein
MKTLQILFVVFFTLLAINLSAQQAPVNIYNPAANAKADIQSAVKKAKAENKHVLIQVGGNWCSWCVRMHKLFHENKEIDSTIKANYVFILVNYSKENKNLPLLKELEFPQRFGFPVLVVLNKEGRRIHTQATDLLEEGKGYNSQKVITFLNRWSVKALDPKSYPEK